jgi:cysteine desulfurase
MLPYLSEEFGNANSLHSFGYRARQAVERARERVAGLLGAEDPAQIIFTSGATEANNWLLQRFDSIAVSPFEHSSIYEPAIQLRRSVMSASDFETRRLPAPVQLVSVMAVNNETGAEWDVREWSAHETALHADATQAVGKVEWSVTGLDFACCSAHKIYGPKGIGCLYFSSDPPEPLIYGGEQENGLRGGTLNVPAIVGFGSAANLAVEEREADFGHAVRLRDIVLEGLSAVRDTRVHTSPKNSPFILSVSFASVEGETLLIEVDRLGFALSAGAACSSRSNEPSHVLVAMGIEEEWRRGTVRISFGRRCTPESAAALATTLAQSVEKLRTMTSRQ